MNDVERRLRELGDRTAQDLTYREVPRRRIVRRARMRRAAIVAAPVAAVVLFAAVAYPRLGSSGDRRTGVPVSVDLAAAAEATQDAGSARVEMSMRMEFGGRTVAADAKGEVDFDDARSHFRVAGVGAHAMAGEFEVVSIGRSLFQRPVGDAKWVRTTVDGPTGRSPFGTDPDELFTYLESVSEDVTSLGEEIVDGVPVTHLRATIDTSALEDVPSTAAVRYDPIDVWIDDANRVRKMALDATVDGPEASGISTMSMTTRFWDFGVPVDVTAPPPEDVTDEPPSTPGGPGTELIGGDSSGSGDSITMVMGEGRVDEPYLEVDSNDPSFIEVCVYSVRPVTEAALTHGPSGRRIIVFEPVPSDGHFAGSHRVACAGGAITQADVERLVDDPTNFSLSVRRRDGSSEIVTLTTTASPIGGGVAEE